jgi:hypothetical protein
MPPKSAVYSCTESAGRPNQSRPYEECASPVSAPAFPASLANPVPVEPFAAGRSHSGLRRGRHAPQSPRLLSAMFFHASLPVPSSFVVPVRSVRRSSQFTTGDAPSFFRFRFGSRFAPLSPPFRIDRGHHGAGPRGTVAPIHALRLRSPGWSALVMSQRRSRQQTAAVMPVCSERPAGAGRH